MWNIFKVNNKLMLSWCFYCYISTYFTPFSIISIIDSEKVNVSWGWSWIIIWSIIITLVGSTVYFFGLMTLHGWFWWKSPKRFFRWFWDFLKEEKVFLPVYLLKSVMLICFSKCNLRFQSVLICSDLNAENITKMSHTQ